MGFFKDFKEDLNQAVNELIPDDNETEDEDEDQIVNTLDDEITDDLTQDIQRMMELSENSEQEEEFTEDIIEDREQELLEDEELAINENELLQEEFEEDEVEDMDDNVDLELLEAMSGSEEDGKVEAKSVVDTPRVRAAAVANDDEVTVISKGTSINGSISSDGSLDIMGSVTGDVECLGKLTITGKIVGNSSAAEVFVNTERLQGSITSEGSVKIGLGTVVIGDVLATSGVIAGAVKGEIDINGPIVIDSTAIIKGNIKAKSVQINNGAVIEGFCSLSYSAVDVDNIFE